MSHERHNHTHTHEHTHADEHSHADGHSHPHDHPPATEDYAARKHPEFVAIDIGGDIGALIVYTDPEMHGVEIEISPAAEDDRRSHKQVLERKINERPAFTAVFDGLHAGRYTLWVDDTARARDVEIDGSAIAELDWRGAAAG
jgi:hypothetical protein